MTERSRFDPPSLFIVEHVRRASPGANRRALDLATGRGRHAAVMATAGYHTFAVDRDRDVLRDTAHRLGARGLSVRVWCADLTASPLPQRWFDLIVVTRYLQRDLCDAIANALTPGGLLLYETFTEAQRKHGRGPTSPDHLLASGELPTLFRGLEIESYEEVDEPDAVARLAARAARSRS